VALYGVSEIGGMLAIFSALHRAAPDIKLVGELDRSVMLDARATKSAEEVERIRRIGQVTAAVVGLVAEFLSSRPVRGDRLVAPDGEPLRIRDVKRRINLWLAERGAENTQGMIFAIGRDAAVPHSSGLPDDLLRLGQTIVFDIFPCEHGGGYYYDLTRTWCLGYAPEAAQALFDQVLSVYRQLVSEVALGTSCGGLTRRACELFEGLGHPTFISHPHTEDGFVHPLGHGVGLSIHETPVFGSGARDVIAPGSVFTVEPGLYYPDRGMGVRLEDTLWARPDGTIEILAEYPMELVLPVRS
jgi:Xaa-Pro aminopeptidase